MALQHHPNGPAVTSADSNQLGYTTVEGVETEYIKHHKDVYTDQFGENLPAEIINLGVEVRLTFTLIYYDETYLNAFLQKSQVASSTLGNTGTVGALIFAGSGTSTFSWASSIDGTGETYSRAILESAKRRMNVSNVNMVDCVVRALHNGTDGTVYTRATPS